MEAAELVANDHEEAVSRERVLGCGEESGVQAVRNSDLGGAAKRISCHSQRWWSNRYAREEVGLEDGLVEGDKGLENLSVVLVEDSLVDLVLKLLVGENGSGLEARVGERGPAQTASGRDTRKKPLRRTRT